MTRFATAFFILTAVTLLSAKSEAEDQADWKKTFAEKVNHCWARPAGTPYGKVDFSLKFNRDGTFEVPPTPIGSALPTTLAAFKDSIQRALIDCQPYSFLPVEYYEQGKSLTFTVTSLGTPRSLPAPPTWLQSAMPSLNRSGPVDIVYLFKVGQ